jgi:hypothetical protein
VAGAPGREERARGCVDFRQKAQRRFAESMRQRIDIERLYRHACGALPEKIDGLPPILVQAEWPTLVG